MLVYIDESGDAGFRVDQGSSPVFVAAKVIIDGSGDREFRQTLSTAIRRKVREGAVRDCRFSDSKTDPLIQLADMCAGAIARSFRADRRDAHRWRDMLRARIDDVWRFR
jgi:hypothetical protein